MIERTIEMKEVITKIENSVLDYIKVCAFLNTKTKSGFTLKFKPLCIETYNTNKEDNSTTIVRLNTDLIELSSKSVNLQELTDIDFLLNMKMYIIQLKDGMINEEQCLCDLLPLVHKEVYDFINALSIENFTNKECIDFIVRLYDINYNKHSSTIIAVTELLKAIESNIEQYPVSTTHSGDINEPLIKYQYIVEEIEEVKRVFDLPNSL